MLRKVASLLIAVALAASASIAWADQYVSGYTRGNGTYVAPYWRSSPDNSYNNNWSVSPNVNPYTLRRGTLAPTWNDEPPATGLGTFGTTTCDAYNSLLC